MCPGSRPLAASLYDRPLCYTFQQTELILSKKKRTLEGKV